MDKIKNNINNNTINQTYYFSNGSNVFYFNNLNVKDKVEEVNFHCFSSNSAIIDFECFMDCILAQLDSYKKKNQPFIKFNGMKLSNNGKFKDFSDFQNINLSLLYIFNDQSFIDKKWLDKDGKINKTIDELLEIKNDERLELLQKYGLGKIKIVEVIAENDGMDAVVLQDTDGNYMIHYTCTNSNQSQDLVYDLSKLLNSEQYKKIVNVEIDHYIHKFAKDIDTNVLIPAYTRVLKNGIFNVNKNALNYNLIGYGLLCKTTLIASSTPVIKPVANNILEADPGLSNLKKALKESSDKQLESSAELAKKYYEKAKSEGKKLNFSGYSLGGSLAENSYLSLLDQYGDDNQVLNDITLFNPYHNNLSKEQVQQLKKHNIKIYCNEGDVVSGIFNQDDFKGVTKNIYIDYKTIIQRRVKDALKDDQGQWDEQIAFSIVFFDLHSIAAANNRALKTYDENGNLLSLPWLDPTEIPFDQVYDEIMDEINRQR